MPADKRSLSSHDALICAVGVAVLLIGSATDSAIAMLVLSVCGLVALVAIDRKRLAGRRGEAVLAAVAVAAVVAYGLVWWLR